MSFRKGPASGLRAPQRLPSGYQFPRGARFIASDFPFFAVGDYDANGLEDCAWILERARKRWAVFLFLNQGGGQYLSKPVFGPESGDVSREVIQTIEKGETLCLYSNRGGVRHIQELAATHDFLAEGTYGVGRMWPFYYDLD